MNLLRKPPLGQKAERSGKDPAHLARVAELPCVICIEYGLQQTSPTQCHHPIHDRFSTRKTPDCMAIPLCEGHHQGHFDTSKVALHREPAEWRRLYGPDYEWVSWVEETLRVFGNTGTMQ